MRTLEIMNSAHSNLSTSSSSVPALPPDVEDTGFEFAHIDGDGAAWYIVGLTAVDSGMLMITDPSYISDFTSDEAPLDPSPELRYGYSYSGACAATAWDSSDQLGGLRGVALKMAGDGLYELLGRFDDDGVLVEVRLRLDRPR
jgi:hypothetical protein